MYIYNPNKFSELIYKMPSSLQYKKIYIDSKYRTSDSNSSSDFKYELPETLTFSEKTVFLLR